MTNNVEWETANMDMPVIASSLIKADTEDKALKVLQTCWEVNKSCKSKVNVDGHVLFFGGFKSEMQYTTRIHRVGMVYDIQPGLCHCLD